jgi:Ca2+-binding EF-hand superfamily protein
MRKLSALWTLAIALGIASNDSAFAQESQQRQQQGQSSSNYTQRQGDRSSSSAQTGSGSQSDSQKSQSSNRSQSQASTQNKGDWSESWSQWWSDWMSDSGSSSGGDRSAAGARAFIRRHDDNEDGKLSRSELPSRMRSDFDRLDVNNDGSITQDEVAQHAKLAARARQGSNSSTPVEVTYVWMIDADQGTSELDELQSAYDALRKVDKNNDGQISRDELRQRREQVVSQWCDTCFDRLDEDEDGELSADEARNSTFASVFQSADRNSDQSLTKSEIHRYLDEKYESSDKQAQSDSKSKSRSGDSSSGRSASESNSSSSKSDSASSDRR